MDLKRNLCFNYKGAKQTIKFPNVGQLIDIESLRQSLTSNKYGALLASGARSAYAAMDMVDMISFFQIMSPGIKEIAGIKNYAEASIFDLADLIKVWKEEINPWYIETMKAFYGILEGSESIPGEAD